MQAFGAWLRGELHAQAHGLAPWSLPDGSFAAMNVEPGDRGQTVRVALAPSAGLSVRLLQSR
jgi:hypothetical protein